jgi:hypothetical protein
MVKEEIQDASNDVHNNAEYIGPAPLETGVFVKRSCNRWAKHRKGHRGRENKSVEWTTQLVGDELADDDGEGKLSGARYSIDGVGSDEL